jgi:hypothetical protein
VAATVTVTPFAILFVPVEHDGGVVPFPVVTTPFKVIVTFRFDGVSVGATPFINVQVRAQTSVPAGSVLSD